MICLCVKLTGGWTRTQTPLTASQPLCSRPRSPVLAAPCRLQPPPTPTLVALGPRSTPEPPRAPPPPHPRAPGSSERHPILTPGSTPCSPGSHLGSHCGFFGNLVSPGTAHLGVLGGGVPPPSQGGLSFRSATFWAGQEGVSRRVCPLEDLAAGQEDAQCWET